MTTKIQLMDIVVITSIKVCYRCVQMERAVDMVKQSSEIENIYKAVALTVLQLLQRDWHELSQIIIKNC